MQQYDIRYSQNQTNLSGLVTIKHLDPKVRRDENAEYALYTLLPKSTDTDDDIAITICHKKIWERYDDSPDLTINSTKSETMTIVHGRTQSSLELAAHQILNHSAKMLPCVMKHMGRILVNDIDMCPIIIITPEGAANGINRKVITDLSLINGDNGAAAKLTHIFAVHLPRYDLPIKSGHIMPNGVNSTCLKGGLSYKPI